MTYSPKKNPVQDSLVDDMSSFTLSISMTSYISRGCTKVYNYTPTLPTAKGLKKRFGILVNLHSFQEKGGTDPAQLRWTKSLMVA